MSAHVLTDTQRGAHRRCKGERLVKEQQERRNAHTSNQSRSEPAEKARQGQEQHKKFDERAQTTKHSEILLAPKGGQNFIFSEFP